MSTRSTIIYKPENGIHIYYEYSDDGSVYIEIVRDGIKIVCKLMSLEEWRKLMKGEE